jgi:hypothetical protein
MCWSHELELKGWLVEVSKLCGSAWKRAERIYCKMV